MTSIPRLAAGNKAGNGSSDWCWLVWDKTAPAGATQFGWLRGAPQLMAYIRQRYDGGQR